MKRARVAPLILSAVTLGCAGPDEPTEAVAHSMLASVVPAGAAPSGQARPSAFSIEGQLTQGGWMRGTTPAGTVSLALDGQAVTLDQAGRFFAAFDRDAGPIASLTAVLGDGRAVRDPLTVSPRAWQIENVNIARNPGGPSADYMRIRQPELDAIWTARQKVTGAQGWRQNFVWPVKGRISGRFGSQRVYRGEPGAYHSGIDIATGGSGTPYVAPADGVVVLAVQGYSLEGNLLIIDHGNGLNSAFLHSSRLHVKEGDAVKQGQHVGDIGMSGRATGPHLHWSLKWNEARLDPLLFTGPMP